MNPSDLINFGNLSRLLAGSRNSITRNRIPAKHLGTIADLYSLIGEWLIKNDSKLNGKR